MKKLMTNLLLLLSAMPGLAAASEDCMIVHFPDHVELVCTGDGVIVTEKEQKLLQNRLTAAPPASQNRDPTPLVEKSTPAPDSIAEAVKPEEIVTVPKTLQIRMDRAAKTMERMRLQRLERSTDPTLPHLTPAP